MWRARFVANADGSPGCRLKMSASEREILRSLPDQLTEVLKALDSVEPPVLTSDDESQRTGAVPPALRRLFPPAYTRDEKAEAAFSSATHADLIEHHLESLNVIAESVDASELTAEQMDHWLAALNDLRLVLGTVVGVTEEMPKHWLTMGMQERLYHLLGVLQEELLICLSQHLPPPVPGADDSVPVDPWGDPIGGLRWDGTTQPERDQ
jgi:prophage DNA circulation protein